MSNSAMPIENGAGKRRIQWSGQLAFVMAAAGSAIGLGNIWKFPYIVGENGGGAFVLFYLLCIALIGLPLMIAEVLIGRRGSRNPVESFKHLARIERSNSRWKLVGWLGIATAFIILGFYNVVGGWVLVYIGHALQGNFHADGQSNLFAELLASPHKLLIFHLLFSITVMVVVSGGIRKGIERSIVILMPVLFVLMFLLLIYSTTLDGFGEGFVYMFRPDFSKLDTSAMLTALGHAFFTLSIGMAVMVAYASHLPHHVSVAKVSLAVTVFDTVVALMAALIIFALVFSYDNLQASAGPGLVFVSLPLAFPQMPGGYFIGILFFCLLAIAAWSSAISLLEAPVEYLEERTRLSRPSAVLIVGFLAWLVGVPAALSFNVLGDFQPLNFIPWLEGKTFFDILDVLSSDVLLPLGGVLIAIFAGWVLSPQHAQEELKSTPTLLYHGWRLLIRYFVPAMVLILLVYGIAF